VKYQSSIVKRLSVRDQPSARVSANPLACSLPELLAAVVGGQHQIEIAEVLVERFDGDVRRLYRAQTAEIAAVPGIGQQTAVRLKAALALGLRFLEPAGDRPVIHSPAEAAAIVQQEMGLLEVESLRVMLLDTRHHLLDVLEICRGSVNASQVRIAEVFKPAIQRTAPAVICLHNHRAKRSTML
jgi:DNA repair protein RadC